MQPGSGRGEGPVGLLPEREDGAVAIPEEGVMAAVLAALGLDLPAEHGDVEVAATIEVGDVEADVAGSERRRERGRGHAHRYNRSNR